MKPYYSDSATSSPWNAATRHGVSRCCQTAFTLRCDDGDGDQVTTHDMPNLRLCATEMRSTIHHSFVAQLPADERGQTVIITDSSASSKIP